MFNNAMPSLADIAAVTGNNDGFSGNNGWWILIILFAIFGGWGNGYGANNSGAIDNYVLSSDFASLQRQIDSATADIKGGLTSIGNGISSLGYDQLNQFNGINQNINNLAFSMQQNCCDLKTTLLANQTANTQAIMDRLNTMETNAMQDKIAQLQAENQNLKFAASQQAQNAYLISQLGNNCCCNC